MRKAEKRAAARAKREAFMREERERGLAAQRRHHAWEAAQNEKLEAWAAAENARLEGILQAYLRDGTIESIEAHHENKE